MILLTFLNIFLLFCASDSNPTVEWNKEETERSVKPLVRKFENSWNNHIIRKLNYHYKSHFGIIIKKGTTFILTIETYEPIQNLYFYCFTEKSREFLKINFINERSSTMKLTTDFDCVPMTSISYNIPVELKITTRNWIHLPVFNTKNLTLQTSHEVENAFYRNVQTFGFVENYYTQILLSANDIRSIISKGYCLYVASQNQRDIIKYYNYLTGASRYVDESDSFSFVSLEKHRLFLRTEICETNCDYGAYFSAHWIACPHGVSEFLKPNRGSIWALLHEFGHYYDIKSDLLAFGDTTESWTNIFAAFYQHKFNVNEYWSKESKIDFLKTVWKYRRGVPFAEWEYKEKLHFYMSFFGYDGTDKSFREFNIRYYSKQSSGIATDNIIPTILEVFLDLYNINLFPFFGKVLKLEQYEIPLLDPDLELRLLTGRPVMPVIDFNINPTDLQIKSEERDLRQYSPLMLMTKMKKKYVDVVFTFETSIDLTNRCLYLNNKCHSIFGQNITMKLLVDVYSIYIAENINEETYFSNIVYHKFVKNSKVNIKVRKISESEIYLPFIFYSFDAKGMNERKFLQIFINYKDMTIAISQLTNRIHYYFNRGIYFSISLKRNGYFIFEYEFSGWPQYEKGLLNVVHEFKVNDQIDIYHRDAKFLQMNLEGYNLGNYNSFVFTNTGLRDASNEMDFSITLKEIKRIEKFNKNYEIDLSHNAYYQVILTHYTNLLLRKGLKDYVPTDWILNSK